MPRKIKRPTRKRSYRKSSRSIDFQKWLFNLVIFCLAVIVVGFMFSMGKRMKGSEEKIDLSNVNHFSEMEIPKELPSKPVVIEVLNGCGVKGIAQQFTNYLRQEGFDVIATGNAEHQNYPYTIMIQRTPENKIPVLNALLMLDENRLQKGIDPTVQADITLIIGRDYNNLPVYKRIQDIKENIYKIE